MNIGYIVPCGSHYGVADYIQEMTKQLAPLGNICLIPVVELNDEQNDGCPIVIRKDRLEDYLIAARYVNRYCQICIIHHSFSGFGLKNGKGILAFTGSLSIPSLVIFHDLFRNIDDSELKIIEAIGSHVSSVVVMSHQSKDVLAHHCKIISEKLSVVEFGFEAINYVVRDDIRKEVGYDGRKVIFAHGCLTDQKGIHVLIEAFAKIQLKYPNAMLHFIGFANDSNLDYSAEKYLNALRLQVRRAGFDNDVLIECRKPSTDEINKYLSACDLYVDPCVDELIFQNYFLAQAVVAGTAIVSTSTLYAREILSDRRGEIVGINNPGEIADAVIKLFANQSQTEILRKSSRDYRSVFMWSRIASRIQKVVENISAADVAKKQNADIDLNLIPHWNSSYWLQFQWRETSTSFLNDKKTPEVRNEVELHAMTLMAVLKLYQHYPSEMLLIRLNFHLNKLRDFQSDDGVFHLSHVSPGNAVNSPVPDEVVGWVIIVLGQMVVDAPWSEQRQMALGMLKMAVTTIKKAESVNCLSASIIGLSVCLQKYPDETLQLQTIGLAQKLLHLFKQFATDDWYWCDDKMCNVPGLVPLALLYVRDELKIKGVGEIVEKSISFLESVMFTDEIFFPAGTKHPFRPGRPKAEFDQSVWDAVSMIWLYDYQLKKQLSSYALKRIFTCYLWFLGENSMRRPLYNFRTGGCNHLLTTGMQGGSSSQSGTFAYVVSWVLTNEAACRQYMNR